ncbi:hypothetical protein OFN31_31905, partial [Escherichia coli]|nr:hypothetical protein [Escherichia coli]
MAERISKICKEYKIDFVFSFSVLTEVGNNEYKDSRLVSCGLNGKAPSPYIHAACEASLQKLNAEKEKLAEKERLYDMQLKNLQ